MKNKTKKTDFFKNSKEKCVTLFKSMNRENIFFSTASIVGNFGAEVSVYVVIEMIAI